MSAANKNILQGFRDTDNLIFSYRRSSSAFTWIFDTGSGTRGASTLDARFLWFGFVSFCCALEQCVTIKFTTGVECRTAFLFIKQHQHVSWGAQNVELMHTIRVC